jgi:two-component sensor histidine kinase
MLTAPALSTTVPASADDRETACRGQTAHLVEKGFRPMNGLLALGERPAGVVAVTAISALLSRISGSTQLGFGDYLRDLCDDLAATCGRSGGPKLTCAAADDALPIGAAITLGLIADLLITNAFLYAFPPGRGGGIAVSFAAAQEAWLLTVEDSGIAMRARASRRDNGLMIARCSWWGSADGWRSR